MFWFIPLIASAASSAMQQSNNTMNNAAQQNARRNSVGVRNSLPVNTSRSVLYNSIMDKTKTDIDIPDTLNSGESFSNTPTASSTTTPSDSITPTTSADTTSSIGSDSSSSGGSGSFGAYDGFGSSGSSSSSGGSGGGSWMSLANSAMGALSSNKTPVLSFQPTMQQMPVLQTGNNGSSQSDMSSIAKRRNLYNYLMR